LTFAGASKGSAWEASDRAPGREEDEQREDDEELIVWRRTWWGKNGSLPYFL
jgi:hypothetical protein